MSLEPIKRDLLQRAEHLVPDQMVVEMRVIEKLVYEATRVTARVLTVKNGSLRLTVTSSSAASQIYMQRTHLIEHINKTIEHKINRIAVQTRVER